MNSLSPGTAAKRPSRQSALACSIRSRELETKFHQNLPRSVHRRAAEQQQAGEGEGGDHGRPASVQNEKLARLDAAALDLDCTVDRKDGALLVLGRKRQARARRERGIGVDSVPQGGDRRAGAEQGTGDQTDFHTPLAQRRQCLARVMGESGLDLLGVARQRHPGLNAGQLAAARPHLRAGSLGMGDPPSGGHPVHVARSDRLQRAEAVAMDDLPGEQVGHGGEPDVRVRTDVQSPAGRERRRPHPVEEDERADHPPQ